VKNLVRKPVVKPAILSQLALAEDQAWQAELAARKAARPLPTKPTWA
jgi:hypothetical protein